MCYTSQAIDNTSSAHHQPKAKELHCPPTRFKERLPWLQLRLIHSHFMDLPCAKKKNSDIERTMPSENPSCNFRTTLGHMLLVAELQSDGTCLIPVEYGYSAMRQKIGIPGGRQFALKGRGMQPMSRWIRHTLCHELYHDIDIENAHPTLLLHLMDQWGYGEHFAQLRRVVNHRDDIMQEAQGKGWRREDMKKLIIVLLYGGPLSSKASSDFPWLNALQRELHKAAEIISERPEHEPLLRGIRASTPREKRGKMSASESSEFELKCKFRLVSHVLDDIENKILQSCIMFLANAKGLSVEEMVLCFDGFMLPKSEMPKVEPEFLTDLSEWVKAQTTWTVKFAVKPMDKVMNISGLEPVFVPGQTVESDVDACKIILEQLGAGKIAFRAEGQTYVKSLSNNKWVIGKDEFKEVMKTYCAIADFYNEKGYKYSHQAQGIRNITTAFCVPEDSLFPSRLDNASRYKIYWTDGVYDFREGRFRPEGSEDMTAARVPRPYPKNAPTTEDLEHYRRVLFTDPLGEEVGTFYLKCLARAVAGHIEDKRWYVVFGDRNAGKGMLEIALRSSLGPEYVSTFNIKAFQEKAYSDDAEYELKWLEGLRWSRLAISNETIEGKKLDSSLSKKLVSGGDPVRLRVPHGMPYSIVPQCTFINNANDLFETSTPDAMETCIMVQSCVKFVDKLEYEAKEESERPAFWRIADPDLKNKLQSESSADIIWHLLLKHYSREAPRVPECIRREAGALKEDDPDNIDEAIQRVFEITGKETDYISLEQMDNAFCQAGVDKKEAKMKWRHKLKLFNNPKAGMVVSYSSTKVEGKKTRVWKGLKLKEQGHSGWGFRSVGVEI